MVEGCGPKISKIVLFVLNLVLWASGIALIGLGSFVTAKQQDYTYLFSEDTLLVVTGITIGVGCFTFIVSFCGCCGAIKENVGLLKAYSAFIFIIIILEVIGGILAFVFADDIEQSMLTGMTNTIHETYGDKTAATEAVDDVQKNFDCCGATNYSDYELSKHLLADWAVPPSCCRANEPLCTMGAKGKPDYPEYVWSNGCVQESIDTVKDHYLLMGIVAIVLLIFEVITIIFACCVIRGISKGYETV